MRERYIVKRDKRFSIEPEEILLDANVLKPKDDAEGDLEQSKIELPIRARKIVIIAFFAALVFSVFLFRIASLQIGYREYFESFVRANSVRSVNIPALRGIIYDRNMTQLLANKETFALVAQRGLFPEDAGERSDMIRRLVENVSLSENAIKDLLGADGSGKDDFSPISVKNGLTDDEVIYVKANAELLRGFTAEPTYLRHYLYGPPFAHALGYAGKVAKSDLKNDHTLTITDMIGKDGIERFYDGYLRGKNGAIEQGVDARGGLRGGTKEMPPENGKSIVLSIDKHLQEFAYDLLKVSVQNRSVGTAGSIVAINPNDGRIVTMVNFPSYDNNIFSYSYPDAVYAEIFNDETKPLFNRAASGQYPPGSTIKPFIAIAALEEDVITPDRKIDDTAGVITVANPYNPSIVYRFPDWKAHGFVDMKEAIAESCNVYFYTIGGGYGNIEGLGIARIKSNLSRFGFGGLTGVDIFGEAKGLLPDPEWKKEAIGEGWFIGDTYNAAIGQGDMLATPLQLASGVAAIANGGTLYRPRIVNAILNDEKQTLKEMEPYVVRENIADPEHITTVREGMRQTVSSSLGSARSLNNLPFAVAGKTGTAQFGKDKKTHAWFIAFAPYDDPQIALAVLVEGGGEGSATAVPIAREYLKEFFGKVY